MTLDDPIDANELFIPIHDLRKYVKVHKSQVPNNGNKVVPKDFTQGKTYDKTSRLPQTGDRSSIGMMFVGIVMLLLSLGLVVINRFTI